VESGSEIHSPSSRKNRITKLMKKKHAEYEYKEITQFLPILKKIPGYQNYFTVDNITLCEPAKLTPSDLENFSSKCKALKKMDLTYENVNNNLDMLMALNLPDGGVDVGDYVDEGRSIPELSKMLIDLLKNGILPMNKLHVYHADVKESNILTGYNTVSNSIGKKDSQEVLKEDQGSPQRYAKLIDWGLSAKTDGTTIPRVFYKKPLQYNIPFSCILFNDTFTEMFDEFIETKPKKQDVQSFIKQFVRAWIKERGDGHLKLILKMMKLSLPIEKCKNKERCISVVVDYLTEIVSVFAFRESGRTTYSSWLMHYFKEIYLKNLDTWGWIMSHSPILEKKRGKYPKLKQIFANYLYDATKAAKVIDVNQLIIDIEQVFS